MWYVYILKCADGTYYTGIAKDMDRRLEEHNSSDLGAKYTRGRRPVKLVCLKRKRDRAEAAREEARIKRLSRKEKERIISKFK